MKCVLSLMFVGWMRGCVTGGAATASDTQGMFRVNAEDGSSDDTATDETSQSGDLDRESSNEDVRTSLPGASSTVAPRSVCC
jgi:hypothetical protein